MTRAAVRWMRVVLPDSGYPVVAILVDLMIEGWYFAVLWVDGIVDEGGFRAARLFWISFCAFAYGVSRVASFHPALNEPYRKWLASTPWNAGKPLPGGPVRQVPQDLIVILAAMLLTREASPLVALVPLMTLLGYLTILASTTRACGDWVFAYMIAFGLGAVALAGRSVVASCLVAMACYPMAYFAIQRSLKRFPWEIDWRPVKKLYTQQSPEDQFRNRLGWPYDALSPAEPKLELPYADGICLSLLVGWIVFIIHYHIGSLGGAIVCAFIGQIASAVPVARICSYMRNHRSPISLLGRLRTGRWIIPRYDVIFIAPVLGEAIVVSTQVFAGMLFEQNDANGAMGQNSLIHAAAVACSTYGIIAGLLVQFVMGPALERWRLEGSHRIIFESTNKQAQAPFVEL